MIEFKPVKEDNIYAIIVLSAQKEIGKCTFIIDKQYVDLLSLDVQNEDELTKEGLVRSALNFAANRNAYIARTDINSKNSKVFIELGFKKDNDYLYSDIPSALNSACCNHCK